MSFTSQNYSVGKQKRMDRVLLDCMILSAGAAAVLGVGAYVFGTPLLGIYTSDKEVIQCGLEILSITTVPYFLCGIMDLIPGALRGMGHSAVPMVLSVIGTVGTRVLWIYAFFPRHRSLYFLFISYPGSWIATIIMQAVCFWFVRKKCIRQLAGTDKYRLRYIGLIFGGSPAGTAFYQMGEDSRLYRQWGTNMYQWRGGQSPSDKRSASES